MAKFTGVIGFGEQQKTAPGVTSDVVSERTYFGDVVRNARQTESGEPINNDLSLDNYVSILADAYANAHIFAIRYIKWAGTLWTITNVETKSPRLILRMGGVYHGPTAPAPVVP